jgi:molecular chaperone DnaJ
MTTAALGATVELETLDSTEQITVKPGTQPNATVTLNARGVPHLRRGGRGDLHVHVNVEIPTRIDAEQEKLLRELATMRGEEQPDAIMTSGNGSGHGSGNGNRERLFGKRRGGKR